jgi:hypothetical protein
LSRQSVRPEAEVNVRRLFWVGPATIAVSVLAVWIAQRISLASLPPLPRFSGSILNSNEPIIFTTVLVTAAVLIFAVVVACSLNPLRTFRRLALGVLLVSCVPNVIGSLSGGGLDLGMLALMVLHVVAWAVTVMMLTRLTIRKSET